MYLSVMEVVMADLDSRLAVVTQYYQDFLKQLQLDANALTPEDYMGNTEEPQKKNEDHEKRIKELKEKVKKLTNQKKDLEDKRSKYLETLKTLKKLDNDYTQAKKDNLPEETLNKLWAERQKAQDNNETAINAFNLADEDYEKNIQASYEDCKQRLIDQNEKAVRDFENSGSVTRIETLNHLAKKFVADGFRDFSLNDTIIFFDQFAKGNLVIELSSQNLQKMIEKLASLPQTDDRAKISHGKFNPMVRLNRWRRRFSLNNAARDLQREQNQHQQKLAQVEYIFNGDKDAYDFASRQYNVVNRWNNVLGGLWRKPVKIKDRIVGKIKSPRPSVEELDAKISQMVAFFKEQTKNGQTVSPKLYSQCQKLQKKRDKLNKKIEKRNHKLDEIVVLKAKISGKSSWNPSTWWTRMKAKTKLALFMRAEKKSLKKSSLNALQNRQQQISEEISKLNNNSSGARESVIFGPEKRALLAQIKSECERSYKIKLNDYNNAVASVNNRFKTPLKELQDKVVKRYQLVNDKTDILDNSTTSGKWLAAVLEKAPATQRKQLEAIVRERKQQKFTNEDEFIQFITEQLQHSGHTKTEKQDLMTVIAKAVAKEEGRGWGQTTAPSPQSADRSNDENTGQTNEPNRVHEGHGNQTPAPDPNWQQQSEQELQASYPADTYELVSPQREGTHADDENVLYQTFKSREDDHTVTIEKPTANDYSLSAKDKDGKDTVPSVDDMKAVMESIKKSGHTTMELGEIKSPEFLARAVAAAEESGIEITNLKEVKERLSNSMGQEQFEQRYGQDQKRETERRQAEAIERSGFTKDLNVKEGTKVDKTVRGLNALAAVSQMSYQEYEEYKKTDEFKSQKLTKNQIKILDGIKKLQQEEKEGKITSKDRRYIRTLSQMIEDYQAIGNRYSDKGKKEVAQKAFARGVVQRAAMQQRQGGR